MSSAGAVWRSIAVFVVVSVCDVIESYVAVRRGDSSL